MKLPLTINQHDTKHRQSQELHQLCELSNLYSCTLGALTLNGVDKSIMNYKPLFTFTPEAMASIRINKTFFMFQSRLSPPPTYNEYLTELQKRLYWPMTPISLSTNTPYTITGLTLLIPPTQHFFNPKVQPLEQWTPWARASPLNIINVEIYLIFKY